MGLNIYLYDLRTHERGDWRGDERFDSYRHSEDYAFVPWLEDGNALYKLLGTPDELNELRDQLRGFMGALVDEDIERVVEAVGREGSTGAFRGEVFERPKNFATARAWVLAHEEPYRGHAWNKQRLLDLLSLMEADNDLWINVSW